MTHTDELVAVILAGGLGERLRSVVSDRPKPMAEIDGKPFLEYLIDRLKRHGISNIVLCTSYMREKIADYFAKRADEHIRIVEEKEPLGTAGALKNAVSILPRTFLVLNGDSFIPVDYGGLLSLHNSEKASVTITLSRAHGNRYGRVLLEGNMIKSFAEKDEASGSALVNAGVYVMERPILDRMPKGVKYSLETELFPQLLHDSYRLAGYVCPKEFIDIGLPESYLFLKRNKKLLEE